MKNRKVRIIIVAAFCLSINFFLLYNLSILFLDVRDKNLEKEKLSNELLSLKEEGKKLKVEANKLTNPEYVAKYAREKYLYTKDNEFVIKIK